MKLKRIENIFPIIRNGANISQNKSDGGIPITRIESIFENQLDFKKLGYAGIENDIFRNYYLEEGDILISHINSVSHLGKVAVFEKSDSKVIHGMNLLCLKTNLNENFPKFLYYYFRTEKFKQSLIPITKKSVNQASFNISNFKNLKIPIPDSLTDQIKIAQLLTKAEKLIAQRKESIALLDDFLRSTFLEMFGDYNSMKNSKIELLGNHISYLTSGSRGWAKYYSTSGAKFLRIQNIGGCNIRTDNMIYVNAPKSAEAERTIVKEGDLIISITADLGRASVVPSNFGEAYINQHLALIRLNKNINPIYAAYFYNMPFGNNSIQSKNRAAVKAGLNFNDIKSFSIVIPPLSLQTQFAQIVEKTEVLKSQNQKSLQELENLFGALSQKAFKGELDLSKMIIVEDEELISESHQKEIDQKPTENVEVEKKTKPVKEKSFTQRSMWENTSILGKISNLQFNNAEGEAVFKKVFSKKDKGFSFVEFESFIKKEGFKYEYHQLKDFIFSKLASKELTQYYADKEWMNESHRKHISSTQDDFAGDGSIYLVPKISAE